MASCYRVIEQYIMSIKSGTQFPYNYEGIVIVVNTSWTHSTLCLGLVRDFSTLQFWFLVYRFSQYGILYRYFIYENKYIYYNNRS